MKDDAVYDGISSTSNENEHSDIVIEDVDVLNPVSN